MQTARLVEKLKPWWSGYLFYFGKPVGSAHGELAGIRILVACAVLELWLRPACRDLIQWLGVPGRLWSGLALVTLVLALALGICRLWIRMPFANLGLFGWRKWSSAERCFFPPLLGISLIAFIAIQSKTLRQIPEHSAWVQSVLVILSWQLIWGFYQELVYRGLLQTELVRRWGPVAGILISNLLFTFGPLHAYHLSSAFANPGHLSIFAGIFVIGLYFGIIFYRSGNLWMIGLLHGVGDFFIDGLAMMN